MLQLGLIGDFQQLEPFVKRAQEHPDVIITGKSSVGTQPQPGRYKLQVPEFNRMELIDRSDALLINKFSLLSFQLVCDMVKKSKHIFATSYPDLSVSECAQLVKLANEAKTVIQIVNPFYYIPAVQWMNNNISKPFFMNISFFGKEQSQNDFLLQKLLMLQDFMGTGPKKTTAVSFQYDLKNIFNNVHLEFGDGSVIQINFGQSEINEDFQIKSYADKQFVVLDIFKNNFLLNNMPLEVNTHTQKDETLNFIASILQTKKAITDIEKYAVALQIKHNISAKLNRYINC
jgi:hypothetical protein